MVRTKIKAKFTSTPEQVWQLIISDLHAKKLASEEEAKLPEEGEIYTVADKQGLPVTFNIIENKPYKRYVLEMDHADYNCKWLADFTAIPKDGTELVLTEITQAKSWSGRIFSVLFTRRSQRAYIKALYRRLNEAVPFGLY